MKREANPKHGCRQPPSFAAHYPGGQEKVNDYSALLPLGGFIAFVSWASNSPAFAVVLVLLSATPLMALLLIGRTGLQRGQS